MKLTEAGRKAKNEYQTQWRQANPDKIRKYMRDYWERQAAKLRAEQQMQM